MSNHTAEFKKISQQLNKKAYESTTYIYVYIKHFKNFTKSLRFTIKIKAVDIRSIFITKLFSVRCSTFFLFDIHTRFFYLIFTYDVSNINTK